MIPGLTLTGRITPPAKLTRSEAREWLARAAVWFETAGDAVLGAQVQRDADDRCVLTIALHPAADDVEIRINGSGTVRIQAETLIVGPGYHAHLCELCEGFAVDFDIQWDTIDDPTHYYSSRDLAVLERHALDALRRRCRMRTHTSREWTGTSIPLGLPDDHGFTTSSAVLTPLGPQSAEWLARASEDDTVAREFFPWWAPTLDAHFYRKRALVLMWCEFPWRAPLTEDEGELTDLIAADLASAYALDPKMAFPWSEWAEVIAAIEADRHGWTVEPIDPTTRREVLKHASVTPTAAPIGYRRRPVRVPIGQGWSIEIPGRFAEELSEDGKTWYAWDERRRLTLNLHSRAEGPPEEPVTGDRSIGLRVTKALHIDGRTLWARIDITDISDQEWAESVWRSLRHEARSDAVAG